MSNVKSQEDDNNQMIILVSKEGFDVTMPYSIGKISKFVRDLVSSEDDGDVDDYDYGDSENEGEVEKRAITIMNKETLLKVVEFCEMYAEEPMREIETPFRTHEISQLVQEQYYQFISNVEGGRKLLFEMFEAANYLSIPPMLQLCCLMIVRQLVGRSEEGVRENLGMEDPVWTEAKKAEVMKEIAWAYEKKKEYLKKYELEAKNSSSRSNSSQSSTK